MQEQNPSPQPVTQNAEHTTRERYALLQEIQTWLEMPMLVLAFVWIALFILESVRGLGPFLTRAGYAIWALFVLQFLLELAIAPRKASYLRANWLTAIALVRPALRLLSVLRFAQLARLSRATATFRGARLVRVLSSLNRGMRALRAKMRRRGLGYVLLLTFVVTVAGAAGMYAFEPEAFESYASALWWTAMLITTIGSDYWPESTERRLLCLFLAVYGLAMFGYLTATLATYFVGRGSEEGRIGASTPDPIAALRRDIADLQTQLRVLRPPNS
jgi:voltage-gated potassium channel